MSLHDCQTVAPRIPKAPATTVVTDAEERSAIVTAESSPLAGSDAVLERALRWIDEHLAEFDPLVEPDTFDVGRGQRIGELAILVRTLARVGGRAEDPRVRRMVALLQRLRGSAAYADRVLRAPGELMLFLESHATLHALGLDDEPMRARIERAIGFGWLAQTERFPHREMDIRSCLDACGIACDTPGLDELYRRSILGTTPSPILLGEHDLYALTHVIMFVCDFGARPPDAMPVEHREPVAALLGSLVTVAARDRHWDLLAEFLLCWSCLELPENELVVKAWEALVRAQLADGAVPGPEASGVPAPFEHLYHTTLVCALAASVRHGKATMTGTRQPRPIHLRATEPADTTDVGSLAARSRAWLRDAAELELAASEASPLRLGQAAVGLAACTALDGQAAQLGLWERILRRLADPDAILALDGVPPLLRCLIAAWSAECGISLPALHGTDGFLRRACAFVKGAGAEHGRHALEVSETWVALRQLGLAPDPPEFGAPVVAAYARGLALETEGEDLEALLLLVDVATACGTRPARFSDASGWIPELIAGLAVSACRRYDLLRASSLLRLGLSVAAPHTRAHRTLRQGVEYLAFNQREDGAFGLFGLELAERRRELGELAGEPQTLLPLTVDCLLTLARLKRDWGPFEELALHAPAVQAMMLA